MAEDDILDQEPAMSPPRSSRILYSVYDLAVQPADYHLVNFLINASGHARKNKFEHLHLVLVPSAGEVRSLAQTSPAISIAWLTRHILAQAATLMKIPCRSSVFSTREDAAEFLDHLAEDLYPIGYKIDTPDKTEAASPSPASPQNDLFYVDAEAVAFVERWISARSEGRKTASLFLPNAAKGQTEWLELADLFNKAGLFTILVPTLEDALGVHPPEWSRHNLYAEAASNTIILTALMQTSHLCVLPNDDRVNLCAFNPAARYIVADDEGLTVVGTSPGLGNLEEQNLRDSKGGLSEVLLKAIKSLA